MLRIVCELRAVSSSMQNRY